MERCKEKHRPHLASAGDSDPTMVVPAAQNMSADKDRASMPSFQIWTLDNRRLSLPTQEK